MHYNKIKRLYNKWIILLSSVQHPFDSSQSNILLRVSWLIRGVQPLAFSAYSADTPRSVAS